MDVVLITVGHHFRTTQKSIRGFWQNAIIIQYSPFAYFQSCFIVFAHKIMYSLGFWFLVITVVTRETEDSAPANVWGVNKANYGEDRRKRTWQCDIIQCSPFAHLTPYTDLSAPKRLHNLHFFISNGEETLKKHVYAKFCGQTRCIKWHAQCFNSELNAMKLIPILHMYMHMFFTHVS